MTSFRLVDGDHEFAVRLSLESKVKMRLVAHLLGTEEQDPEFANLGERLSDAITNYLVGNVLPPSSKQLSYAKAICVELDLQLPGACLKSRESMQSFISEHAQVYQDHKSNRLKISK